MEKTVRTRKKPRISVNKLGSYLTGTESNRIRILEDQKYPSAFMSAYYSFAQRAIAKYAAVNFSDSEIIIDAIQEMESLSADSDWKRTKQKNNIKAIKSFFGFCKDISVFDELDIIDTVPKTASLSISGVDVSIRPELLTMDSENNGQKSLGAVKLYFSKSEPLLEETADIISTLVHNWAEKELADDKIIVPAAQSLVIDVFDGKLYEAPVHRKRKRNNIAAACDGIRMQWAQL